MNYNNPPDYIAYNVDAKKLTAFIYLLYILGLFVGFTAFVAIVLNYIKYKDVKGTFCASHFKWQIRTFWWGLLWLSISFVLKFVIVGFVTGAIAWIWIAYRVIKGCLYLYENKAMY